jgi:sugar phosphate isomerase/epimerase
LALYAEKRQISLMVENNVFSEKNLKIFPENPLLMCDPLESSRILDLLPKSVGLLLDVAHLKVSSNSLKFDITQMFSECSERIVGYHLSDNNGLEDSNQVFDANAWFWPYLKNSVKYISIEVYRESPYQLKLLQELTTAMMYK